MILFVRNQQDLDFEISQQIFFSTEVHQAKYQVLKIFYE